MSMVRLPVHCRGNDLYCVPSMTALDERLTLHTTVACDDKICELGLLCSVRASYSTRRHQRNALCLVSRPVMLTAQAARKMRCRMSAGFDPGVVLMRNIPEVRAFWWAVRETLADTVLMAQVW